MNIVGRRLIWFALSAAFIGISAASLFTWGMRFGVDFTGGTLLDYRFSQNVPSQEQIREVIVAQNVSEVSIQSGSDNSLLMRLPPLDESAVDSVREALSKKYPDSEELKLETVGPTIGKELTEKTLVAGVLAIIGIIIYIAWVFREMPKGLSSWMFGITAIIALLHDTFIVVGIFSLFGYFFGAEADALFVSALLTVMSFSVHDTIVVFDRIRENVRVFAGEPFEVIVNRSLNETIVRSMNNSFTILFMLAALLLLGGDTLRWFVAALFVGTVVGTYSSTFLASPILVVWQNWVERRRKLFKS